MSSRSRPAKAPRTASDRVTSNGSGRALPPREAISRATSSSSLRGPAHQHQLGAGSRERQRDGAAYAASGAGHQRNFAIDTKDMVSRRGVSAIGSNP